MHYIPMPQTPPPPPPRGALGERLTAWSVIHANRVRIPLKPSRVLKEICQAITLMAAPSGQG